MAWTRFPNEKGAISVIANGQSAHPLMFWLIRHIDVFRGTVSRRMHSRLQLYPGPPRRSNGHLDLAAQTQLTLVDGQQVVFALRIAPEHKGDSASGVDVEQAEELIIRMRPKDDPVMTRELLDHLFGSTNNYWTFWIRKHTC
ncbi:hypothetical protein EDB19DRAFT_1910032 [Suillus lakei]|nr:hypothetical protein EDB19DRAFT_1910032 [Suillus lakei]